jgi:hypothetical protein
MITSNFLFYILLIIIFFIIIFFSIKLIFKNKEIIKENEKDSEINDNVDDTYKYKELSLKKIEEENEDSNEEKEIDFYNNNFKSGRDLNDDCEKIVCKGSKENMYVWNHECKVLESESCPGKSGDGTYIDKCPESIIDGKRVCQPICGEIPKCN